MISEPQIAAKLAAAAAHSIARQPSPQPSTESAPRRTATMRSQNAPPDDAEAEEFTPRGVPTGEGFRRAMSTRMVAVQTPLPPSRKPSETSLRKFVVLNHTEPMPSRRPTPEPRIPSRPTTPQVLVTAPSPPAASRKLSVESTLRRAFKPLEDSATSSLKPSRDSVFVPPAETRSRDPPPSSFPGLGAAQARALSKRPSMNHSHSQTESLAAVPPRASISVDSLQPFEAAILRVPTARPIPTVGGDLRRRATRHMAEQNHEARRIVEPTRSASMRHRTASAYNQGHSNYF
ncbi:hypothetical protein BOTBODRAFT_36938 [Botryobasidium botryosum FD-172 SS1]|uniref:Uncharacterized protein n=1 Tax=Botryobasidium botryosum (strain FD-172 SS1) TaxID=930990 RepID=A0A067M485_BOTB1|nr:hypothetical protein BOTBODRAFT_36938 [Botryobasidium botryosum FD-172 SS1]